jgi:ATP-dependent Clp protease ATP-binding subunit ClpB
VDKGYDPIYGARPLKRAIQKYLENPLSMEILKGEIPDGSRIEARVENDRLVFDKQPTRTHAENSKS